jgi:hypothetical protein
MQCIDYDPLHIDLEKIFLKVKPNVFQNPKVICMENSNYIIFAKQLVCKNEYTFKCSCPIAHSMEESCLVDQKSREHGHF